MSQPFQNTELNIIYIILIYSLGLGGFIFFTLFFWHLFLYIPSPQRKWQPTPALLPGKFHGQRSLIGYSPWGLKKSDTTEGLHFLSSFLSPQVTGLGNYFLTGFNFLAAKLYVISLKSSDSHCSFTSVYMCGFS